MPEAKPITTLDIKPNGLGSSLGVNFLTVPRYQRAYSWDEEDVRNFLADINSAFSNGEAEYFLGSIVLQGVDTEFEVVDGQQRLTTATIFIAAARDLLRAKGQPDVAAALESQFLLKKDTWSQEKRAKLTLSVYDNDFYLQAVLLCEVAAAPKRESHHRIAKAKLVCTQFLEGLANSHADWFDRLHKLMLYLEHKARVVQVVVPNHANAYVIFETLNDRGKDLSASDLLKNFLFGRADDRVNEVQALWNKMLGILEVHGGDAVVITFIRQLWSATRELAREKELFSKIKDRIATSQQAVDFANELVAAAHYYSAILNPSHPLWVEKGTEVVQLARSLHLLKLERYRPALLAVLARLDKKEITQAMRYILNGSVRYLISVGAGGGQLEGAYSEAARRIMAGEIKTALEFGKAMVKIIPNDDEFHADFVTYRSSKSALARYLLGALEREARGAEGAELVPNDDIGAVNLEHVLPETPGANWPGISAEAAEAYCGRLGNQALLDAKKNSTLGNEPFDVKREVLKASEFVLTRDIGDLPSWGPQEIGKRQVVLADLAVKVWAYKT